jgi:hypothetical protein
VVSSYGHESLFLESVKKKRREFHLSFGIDKDVCSRWMCTSVRSQRQQQKSSRLDPATPRISSNYMNYSISTIR